MRFPTTLETLTQPPANPMIEVLFEDKPTTRVRFQVLAFTVALAAVTYLDRVCIARAEEDVRHDLGLIEGADGVRLQRVHDRLRAFRDSRVGPGAIGSGRVGS